MIIVQLSKTEGIKPKEKNSREDTVCENLGGGYDQLR